MIKKLSRWVNVNLQQQIDNRQAKHFPYDFKTKNRVDVYNFLLKFIDEKNKEIEFEGGEKKFPIINFFVEFLA